MNFFIVNIHKLNGKKLYKIYLYQFVQELFYTRTLFIIIKRKRLSIEISLESLIYVYDNLYRLLVNF